MFNSYFAVPLDTNFSPQSVRNQKYHQHLKDYFLFFFFLMVLLSDYFAAEILYLLVSILRNFRLTFVLTKSCHLANIWNTLF